MSNSEREKVWEERVAQWQASGLSQRAYAIEQGFPVRQVGYWVRRLTKREAMPTLLPVRVAQAGPVAVAISLRNEHGWTLSLPTDMRASWLAELMRAL
ncbi:IS66 family insertion sequence hypothetical protein (plasmid) [Massilia violaceinigra]|uniref:Uncharacterized protein n=1 Tax=Massilia violaceinigra TaxID=2045208 RepID=A0A2D2DWB2_9BURK|nr:hypothetical protein [Massilia violaceinigra]ATQ73727.1 IS66 family insertion sequence hypothetical protein [Massilia violaceinigra]ATQ77737.1 IS66 family insertion sequence hypothetical protein [Massilia violaceinigra]ATQ79255.1 IS66 family insertion sequence hypothetical protein [Massilia violaceinigra]